MTATADYSDGKVPRNETAFPLCRATDSLWNKNVVSLLSSMISAMHLLISCTSSVAWCPHKPSVSIIIIMISLWKSRNAATNFACARFDRSGTMLELGPVLENLVPAKFLATFPVHLQLITVLVIFRWFWGVYCTLLTCYSVVGVYIRTGFLLNVVSGNDKNITRVFNVSFDYDELKKPVSYCFMWILYCQGYLFTVCWLQMKQTALSHK